MPRIALVLLVGMALGAGLVQIFAQAPGCLPVVAGAPPESGAEAGRQGDPVETARQAEAEVVIYTTSWCGWCARTLAHLDDRGVFYVNKDIETNPDWARELRQKTGSTGVPVIEIDGELVRGFNPDRIDQLLARSAVGT